MIERDIHISASRCTRIPRDKYFSRDDSHDVIGYSLKNHANAFEKRVGYPLEGNKKGDSIPPYGSSGMSERAELGDTFSDQKTSTFFCFALFVRHRKLQYDFAV